LSCSNFTKKNYKVCEGGQQLKIKKEFIQIEYECLGSIEVLLKTRRDN